MEFREKKFRIRMGNKMTLRDRILMIDDVKRTKDERKELLELEKEINCLNELAEMEALASGAASGKKEIYHGFY